MPASPLSTPAPGRLLHRDVLALLPTFWRQRERWLRWVGVLLLGSTFALVASVRGTLPLWKQELISLLVTGTYWQGNAAIFFWLRRRLPGYEITAARILLHVPLALGYIAAISCFNAWVVWWVSGKLEPYWTTYQHLALTGLLTTAGLTGVYGMGYFFYEWRKSVTRALELERDAALSELEALKQQVDPHFLFNSLNTMAALIGDNPPAQDFLGELASVYRYVLLSKERTTVPLSQELAFAEAYLYLNRVRFGEGLQVSQHIPPAAGRLHVPPLVVQLLLENALKHNAFDRHYPLRITLEATTDTLRVTNTVQLKATLEAGTRQGLRNIVNRFRLLTDRAVLIEQAGGEFAVTLPLLPTP